MAAGKEPPLFERAVRAKQILEQALRSSAQRAIPVMQTHRQVAVAESSGLSSLRERLDALDKKLGVTESRPLS